MLNCHPLFEKDKSYNSVLSILFYFIGNVLVREENQG